jgi:nucleoside-triphosphatase THEP1
MTNNQVYIITGGQGTGKTSFLVCLIKELHRKRVKVGGFVAEGLWKEDKRFGFNLIGITDFASISLCTKDPNPFHIKLGNYYFNPDAIKIGNEILQHDQRNAEIIIVDEIGIFELQEKLWFNSFQQLLASCSKPLIISVRDKIVDEVIKKFALQHVQVFGVKDHVPDIIDTILAGLKNS